MILPRIAISESDVARHYDELDRFYLDVWGEHVHHGLWVSGDETPATAVRQLVDLVAAEADVKFNERVCDIGAGYGAAARQIALDYGARVTALTISPMQHEYARHHAPEAHHIDYVLGDWLNNDLPDDHFDVVYAIECASHMSDPMLFVSEAFRVLKPGGRLIICAWVVSQALSSRERKHLVEPICNEGRLAHLSTAREYVELIENAGLILSGFQDLSRHVQKTWPVCLSRTLQLVLTKAAYLRFILSGKSLNRIFLVTMLRIWLAYRRGALRYILFRACKPFNGGGQYAETRL